MRRLKCVAAIVLALLIVPCVPGQEPANGPAEATKTPPETTNSSPDATTSSQDPTNASPEWTVGPVTLSGLIDLYYSLNFNHPASRTNQLRNFDVKANQFSLNMAKLTLEHAPAPAGFRVDLGFGRAFDIVHGAESGPEIFRNIEQAFFSYKFARAKGLQVDLGKFVTSAGAEVIETNNNWNYSRSLLFSYAIPYYHFGLRAAMPVYGPFGAGVQLVNGWNNVEDNNSGKTVGLTGTITTTKFAWFHNYYTGTEKPDGEKGRRHLYDTTLLLTLTPRLNSYINFDYGVDRLAAGGNARWVGIAGAARYAVSRWFAVAPRIEWFNDAEGFATGTAQKLKEATLTFEFKMKDGLLSRLEYRRDWSNTRFFERGATPAAFRNQDTLLAGFVAFFGPGR